MVSKYWEYRCDCGTSIQAKTWDPQELPELICPDCGHNIETLERIEESGFGDNSGEM